jgi:hypothetical protein
VKIGISTINKFYQTSAINRIIGFIEILSPIKFSPTARTPGGASPALAWTLGVTRPAQQAPTCQTLEVVGRGLGEDKVRPRQCRLGVGELQPRSPRARPAPPPPFARATPPPLFGCCTHGILAPRPAVLMHRGAQGGEGETGGRRQEAALLA